MALRKKWGFFILFVLLMFVFSGCSKDSSGESDLVSIAIADASFILSDADDGVSVEDTTGLLAVELEVKNNSKSSIDVSPFDGIKLYDGDEQLSAETDLFNSELGLSSLETGEIGPEKLKKVTAIFYVDTEKQYEIGVKPFVLDPDTKPKEVTIPLNPADYAESFEQLNVPSLALSAYIDTIYLEKENVDYEKYVSVDKNAHQSEAKNLFADAIETAFSNGVPDEEIDKAYSTYKSLLAEKAEFHSLTTDHANGKAIVSLEYTTIPLGDLYQEVSDHTREYLDNTDDYDRKKAEEYAISKLDQILNSIDAKQAREKLDIVMVEKDGKWSVDTSDWNSERLVKAFAAGSL